MSDKDTASPPKRRGRPPKASAPPTAMIDAELENQELLSVGYRRIPGSRLWSSYIVRSKGNQVLEVQETHQDVRGIVEEDSKTNFVHLFCVRDETSQ